MNCTLRSHTSTQIIADNGIIVTALRTLVVVVIVVIVVGIGRIVAVIIALIVAILIATIVPFHHHQFLCFLGRGILFG